VDEYMTRLNYICRILTEHRVEIPSELLQEDFVETLLRIGFEIPRESVFEQYIGALNKRYSNRFVIPFAKSSSSDDTAGIVVGSGRVIEFHDFAEQGFEQPRYFIDIGAWLNSHRSSNKS
jgi:hypothetical protein